jgi:hypothetical protein
VLSLLSLSALSTTTTNFLQRVHAVRGLHQLRGQLRQAADADAIRFLLAQGEATAA